jgi:hypothetical protein
MFEEDMERMTESAGQDMARMMEKEMGHALLQLGNAFKV